MQARSSAVPVYTVQRGVSLIEVMVALLVFSIGMLGLAGLIIVSLRSTQSAYLRTQVTTLAQSIGDRMRANPIGVWDGAYNGSYPLSSAVSVNCSQSDCSPDQMAQQDGQQWSQELSAALPGVAASLSCTNTGSGPDSTSLFERPPYGGNCHLVISWSERALGDTSHATAALQSFSWDFQP